MPLRLVVALLAALVTACASSKTTSGRRAACDLSPSDQAFVLGRPVFRDCAVDRPARFVSYGSTRPDFRPASMRSECYSADLKFVVDSTGRPETSTAQIERSNDRSYAEAVLATIASWRYDPALLNGVPVRQTVTTHQTMTAVVSVRPAGSPPPTTAPLNAPRC